MDCERDIRYILGDWERDISFILGERERDTRDSLGVGGHPLGRGIYMGRDHQVFDAGLGEGRQVYPTIQRYICTTIQRQNTHGKFVRGTYGIPGSGDLENIQWTLTHPLTASIGPSNL